MSWTIVSIILILLITVYTIFYAIELWQKKNYLGSIATGVLSVVTFGLPLYMIIIRMY